jgi:hypothetical protein
METEQHASMNRECPRNTKDTPLLACRLKDISGRDPGWSPHSTAWTWTEERCPSPGLRVHVRGVQVNFARIEQAFTCNEKGSGGRAMMDAR